MNSAKHNKPGCHITINVPKVNNKNEHVSIIIADNGCGISEVKQDILNKKDFFNTSINQAHGLGLIIVKSIVTAHHGQITIESKEGQGVSIIITMPKVNLGNKKE
ncbi:ATP-binding protein [Clostridium sp. CF012]|nr:ATP-binding protein [Clostridium sp. CF012]